MKASLHDDDPMQTVIDGAADTRQRECTMKDPYTSAVNAAAHLASLQGAIDDMGETMQAMLSLDDLQHRLSKFREASKTEDRTPYDRWNAHIVLGSLAKLARAQQIDTNKKLAQVFENCPDLAKGKADFDRRYPLSDEDD